MKFSRMILFIAFLFLLPGTASPSVDSRETKRVLVLYSLEKGNAGQDRIDARLREILGANKTFNIQIYNEYLDLVRFPSLEGTSVTVDYLAHKYSRERPDVVITVLPPALKCIERNGSPFFKDTPVIAAFIPRDVAESLAHSPLGKRAAGLIAADNVSEIAQSALRLRPGTKHIAFVAGTSFIDISFKVPVLREIKRAAPEIELIDLSGLTIGETMSRVHSLPPDTVVFYTSIFRDKEGVNLNPPDVVRLVSDASNAPVFGFVDTQMGKGIVGGGLSSLKWQIEKMAELTLDSLAGGSLAEAPILAEDRYQPVYDLKELKRWRIPLSSLPKGSMFINKEASLIDRYKRYIFGSMIFLIFQTALIFVLITFNRQKKRAYAELQDYTGRYHELLRVDRSSRLGELTASLAHELNQPLTAILSNAQAALRFLASGKNDPELTREILQNIVQDDKRAADVIRSLRSMVKKGEIRKEPISINEVLHEVIQIAKSALIAQDMHVKTFLNETLPLVIADKTQIQQVALNLIMNAMDAIAQSAPNKRRIILRTELLEGFVVVAVRDYGPEIPAEKADKIFEPFYTTKSNGLGMGLAVCKSIIEQQGGRIWFENDPKGGKTFFFSLKTEDYD